MSDPWPVWSTWGSTTSVGFSGFSGYSNEQKVNVWKYKLNILNKRMIFDIEQEVIYESFVKNKVDKIEYVESSVPYDTLLYYSVERNDDHIKTLLIKELKKYVNVEIERHKNIIKGYKEDFSIIMREDKLNRIL
jgi:hypothetical protein